MKAARHNEIQRLIHDAFEDHNRAYAASATFDERVAHLERLCRRQVTGDSGARVYAARRILSMIAEVRSSLSACDWQRAASDAVVVGALALQADFIDAQVRKSLQGVAQRRENSRAFSEAVTDARRKHPSWPVRRLAHLLLVEHGRDHDDTPEGRRKATNALAKRISRLRPRR